MRRRLWLALLALLVVVAVVISLRYRTPANRSGGRVASTGTPADTLAQSDSAARANARAADTMCLASRIGLPCDPR
jgi:hypothetical protein